MLYLGRVDWFGAKAETKEGKKITKPIGFIKNKKYAEGIFFHRTNFLSDIEPEANLWVMFTVGIGRDNKDAAQNIRLFNIQNLRAESSTEIYSLLSSCNLSEAFLGDRAALELINDIGIWIEVLTTLLESAVSDTTLNLAHQLFIQNIKYIFEKNISLANQIDLADCTDLFRALPSVFEVLPINLFDVIPLNVFIAYATPVLLIKFFNYTLFNKLINEYYNQTKRIQYLSDLDSIGDAIAQKGELSTLHEDIVVELKRISLKPNVEIYRDLLIQHRVKPTAWVNDKVRAILLYHILNDDSIEILKVITQSAKHVVRVKECVEKFDQQNFDLINHWISYAGNKKNINFSNTERSFEQNKMISARLAEFVAQDVFSAYGFETQDIALKQVAGSSLDWTLYDFTAESPEITLNIDVKNARASINNKQGYSEFCIPAFKKDRNNIDVLIAGVYSPYKADALDKRDNIDTVFLGIADQPEKLKKYFCTQTQLLDDLSFNRGGEQNYLPVWVFSYPNYAFKVNPQKFAREKLNEYQKLFDISDLSFLTFSDIDLNEEFVQRFIENYIWLHLYALKPLKETLVAVNDIQRLSTEEVEFYNALSTASCFLHSLSLPVVFLTVLTQYLNNLSKNIPFASDFYKGLASRMSNIDPMQALDNLVDNLIKLDSAKAQHKLSEYKIFKLQGGSLLLGRRTKSDKKKYDSRRLLWRIYKSNNEENNSKYFRTIKN